jgi:hypothetical protein
MLASWKILLGDDNPIPRTTRGAGGGGAGCPVPVRLDLRWPGPPWPRPSWWRGAGELAERARGAEGIVRRGDTSRDAMREEARFVMGIMHERVRALGAAFRRVTTINVYTEHPHSFLVKQFLAPVGPAAIHGMRGFPRRPPIQGWSSRWTCGAWPASWCCRGARRRECRRSHSRLLRATDQDRIEARHRRDFAADAGYGCANRGRRVRLDAGALRHDSWRLRGAPPSAERWSGRRR